jgi:hypothetical protein
MRSALGTILAPVHYLRGVSMGDFQEGRGAGGVWGASETGSVAPSRHISRAGW